MGRFGRKTLEIDARFCFPRSLGYMEDDEVASAVGGVSPRDVCNGMRSMNSTKADRHRHGIVQGVSKVRSYFHLFSAKERKINALILKIATLLAFDDI